MKRIGGVAVWVVLAACSKPEAAAETRARPVVVELFTSQGCSSCPPADRLLSKLGRDGVDGGPVIPLAFHVDYWNYIGWQDPFSSPRWSERQRRYAAKISKGRVYTPQLVVDGAAHAVGSDEDKILELVRAARRRPQTAAVSIALNGADLRVDVKTSEPARVWLASTKSGLTTDVRRGENRGRKLREDFVVRELRGLGIVNGKRTLMTKIGAGEEDFVILVQSTRTLRILTVGTRSRQ